MIQTILIANHFIAPSLLAFIERFVRFFHQIIDIGDLIRIGGHANTYSRVDFFTIHIKGSISTAMRKHSAVSVAFIADIFGNRATNSSPRIGK